MFPALSETEIIIIATFDLLSASALNIVWYKNYMFHVALRLHSFQYTLDFQLRKWKLLKTYMVRGENADN